MIHAWRLTQTQQACLKVVIIAPITASSLKFVKLLCSANCLLLLKDMHICNNSDKTGHGDSLPVTSVNGIPCSLLTCKPSCCIYMETSAGCHRAENGGMQHWSTQHALALHNKQSLEQQMTSRYVTAMLLAAERDQAEDRQTVGCLEDTLAETHSWLTAIAGGGSISWLAVLAHLQIC